MRRRDRPLDIFKKLTLIRAVEDILEDEVGNSTKLIDSDLLAPPAIQKKKLNIPIGDVNIDPEYEINVKANFQIPNSYVRHTKKIGDEGDITIDYILEPEDKEWLAKHPKLSIDKDAQKYITNDSLEVIINLLERTTGYGDPVQQPHIERMLAHTYGWPMTFSLRVLPEIYQYWISKRSKLHKPLCRRYWPQTSATDTNPHLVFRPREKERYKLRKHRRNDLESFRKMQVLRCDFAKAQSLLRLVLEREKLKMAILNLNSLLFNEKATALIKISSNASTEELTDMTKALEFFVADPEVSSDFRYSMSLEVAQLLTTSMPTLTNNTSNANTSHTATNSCRKDETASATNSTKSHKSNSESNINSMKTVTTAANKTTAANSATTAVGETQSKDLTSTAADGGLDGGNRKESLTLRLSVKSIRDAVIDTNASTKSSTTSGALTTSTTQATTGEDGQPLVVPTDPKRKKRPSSSRNPARTSSDKLSMFTFGATDSSGALIPVPSTMTTTLTLPPPPIIDGPAQICRPQWPSFMDRLDTREKINLSSNMSEYLDVLESMEPMEGSIDCIQPIKKFRYRGRVGRGGRLVMDRIPVYAAEPLTITGNGPVHYITPGGFRSQYAPEEVTYIYPTYLRPVSDLSSSSAIESGMSTSAATPKTTSGSSLKCPPCIPAERPQPTPLLYSKEHELYQQSDSEDELVEVREFECRPSNDQQLYLSDTMPTTATATTTKAQIGNSDSNTSNSTGTSSATTLFKYILYA